jgi:hypothetical protein
MMLADVSVPALVDRVLERPVERLPSYGSMPVEALAGDVRPMTERGAQGFRGGAGGRRGAGARVGGAGAGVGGAADGLTGGRLKGLGPTRSTDLPVRAAVAVRRMV